MSLTITRLRYQKRGFRAKLSSGWFVLNNGQTLAGPFETKGRARHERAVLKERAMHETKTEKETTSERQSDDPSDSSSAKRTGTGEPDRDADRSRPDSSRPGSSDQPTRSEDSSPR
jgi:hypothetical protein